MVKPLNPHMKWLATEVAIALDFIVNWIRVILQSDHVVMTNVRGYLAPSRDQTK